MWWSLAITRPEKAPSSTGILEKSCRKLEFPLRLSKSIWSCMELNSKNSLVTTLSKCCHLWRSYMTRKQRKSSSRGFSIIWLLKHARAKHETLIKSCLSTLPDSQTEVSSTNSMLKASMNGFQSTVTWSPSFMTPSDKPCVAKQIKWSQSSSNRTNVKSDFTWVRVTCSHRRKIVLNVCVRSRRQSPNKSHHNMASKCLLSTFLIKLCNTLDKTNYQLINYTS